MPLLKTTCRLFGYFSGLGNVASPSSNEYGSKKKTIFRLDRKKALKTSNNGFEPISPDDEASAFHLAKRNR